MRAYAICLSTNLLVICLPLFLLCSRSIAKLFNPSALFTFRLFDALARTLSLFRTLECRSGLFSCNHMIPMDFVIGRDIWRQSRCPSLRNHADWNGRIEDFIPKELGHNPNFDSGISCITLLYLRHRHCCRQHQQHLLMSIFFVSRKVQCQVLDPSPQMII